MLTHLARFVTAAASTAAVTICQCTTTWGADYSLPAVGPTSAATMWDADGAGPDAARLVVGNPQSGVVVWDETSGAWQAVGNWANGYIYAFAATTAGELFASHFNPLMSPTVGLGVSRWDGVDWVPAGIGFNGSVLALTAMPNGDVVAGGVFWMSGTTPVSRVARWQGGSWSAMGAGLPSTCSELVVMPNGDLLAGGAFGVSRWDGASWSSVGSGAPLTTSLCVLANGDLAVGTGGNEVWRFDGVTWTQIGGSVLQAGAESISGLVELPNGDLLGCESSLSVGPYPRISRWDGTTWTPDGTANHGVSNLMVRGAPHNDVLAIGRLSHINGVFTNCVARLTTSCEPAITTIANGCAGSGTTITAESAWAGGTWQATVSGLAQPGLVIGVLGLAPAGLALDTLFPQAVAGCTLHVQPTVLELLPMVNGEAVASLALPNVPALAGVTFRHQMVALEISATAITSVVATDAFELTVGVF